MFWKVFKSFRTIGTDDSCRESVADVYKIITSVRLCCLKIIFNFFSISLPGELQKRENIYINRKLYERWIKIPWPPKRSRQSKCKSAGRGRLGHCVVGKSVRVEYVSLIFVWNWVKKLLAQILSSNRVGKKPPTDRHRDFTYRPILLGHRNRRNRFQVSIFRHSPFVGKTRCDRSGCTVVFKNKWRIGRKYIFHCPGSSHR